MKGKIKDFLKTAGNEYIITLVTRSECADEIEPLREEEVEFSIKKYRKRRSLNANAYAWVLIDKIAQKMKQRPEEVYREAIRHIAGVSEYLCIREKAVGSFCERWSKKGLGWFTEPDTSKIEGCVTVKVWYGSSTYDTEQMSALIDNLVQDAKALGITTETPDEIARIKSLWGENE